MKKVINASPEALELINEIVNPSFIEDALETLDAAEENLSYQAYTASEAVEGNNLFVIAYQVRLFSKKLSKLKNLLENGREE